MGGGVRQHVARVSAAAGLVAHVRASRVSKFISWEQRRVPGWLQRVVVQADGL